MIIVLAELGGERLLGKAREMADSSGLKVLALCSKERREAAQRLVSLGADEVQICNATGPVQWTEVLANLVKTATIKMILFPSNIMGNLILGRLSFLLQDKLVFVGDGIDQLSESDATRNYKSFSLRRTLSQEKISALSVRLNSMPEPFEDSSRYGKTKEVDYSFAERESLNLAEFGSKHPDSSTHLTILCGAEGKKMLEQIKKLSEKFNAKILEISGALEVVYGPCLAVEVNTQLRDLPSFEGELIALNSSEEAPILKVADLPVVSSSLDQVIERMLS